MLKARSDQSLISDLTAIDGAYLASATTTLNAWTTPIFTGGTYLLDVEYSFWSRESASKYLQLLIGSQVIREIELLNSYGIKDAFSLKVSSDTIPTVPPLRNQPWGVGLTGNQMAIAPATTAFDPTVTHTVSLKLITLAGTPTADWVWKLDFMKMSVRG